MLKRNKQKSNDVDDDSDDESKELPMLASKRVKNSFRNDLPNKHGDHYKYWKTLLGRNDRGADMISRIQIEIDPETTVRNVFTCGHFNFLQPGLAQLLCNLMVKDLSVRIVKKAELAMFMSTKDKFLDEVTIDLAVNDPNEVMKCVANVFKDFRWHMEIEKLDFFNAYKNKSRNFLRRNVLELVPAYKRLLASQVAKPYVVKAQNYTSTNSGARKNDRGRRSGRGNFIRGRNNGRYNGPRQTQNICFKFNSNNTCHYPDCKYEHRCLDCGAIDHGSVACKNKSGRK